MLPHGAASTSDTATAKPSFAEALAFWHRLGWISFGGPAGQIAIMQHELVDRRRWIDQTAFLHGLNFCMLLPGPEATQLAAYVGWRLHGWRGAVAAGVLFVLPSVAILWLLSWVIVRYGELRWLAAVLDGIKPMVIAIVAHAVWRIGRRALKGRAAVALAVAAFAAIRFAGIDFPWIVTAAGLIGIASAHLPSAPFMAPGHGDVAAATAAAAHGGWRRAAGLLALFVAIWGAAVGGVLLAFGIEPFAGVARLFTLAAFVTFGGAYAVLPYVADAAVNDYGWLTAADMINGLALAETTPGPLIMVLQYVGFYAGWNRAGALDPLVAATVAALLTTFVTFLPSFLFILVAAPYIESLGRLRRAASALGAITAAVVGVVANLAVFLGIAVLWPNGGVDWIAALMMLAALAVLLRWGPPIHWLVAAGALLGLARMLAGA